MSDPYAKANTGQRLRIPATAWNGMIDVLKERDARGRTPPLVLPDGVVYVKNDSGADRAAFDVLGIDSPLIDPGDNLAEFQRERALVGVVPTVADHTGKFVILLQPLVDGAVGLAAVAGVCAARIAVGNDGDTHADVTDSDATTLTSGSSGAAQILWKDPGTGSHWAIVRFGGGSSDFFRVLVEKDGGSDGTNSTAASWTYTVRTTGGDELGTAVEVARPRPLGEMTFQAGSTGSGVAFYEAGVLKLWDAGEIQPVNLCVEGT